MTAPADPTTKQCPNCAEQVQDAALVCRYCGFDFVTLSRPQQPAPQQTKVNGFSIAALVLGIVWIYWIGSLLAVIFGHVALSQIKKADGRQTGRGMAIAGLVLGYIGIATFVVFFGFVFIFSTEISDKFSEVGASLEGS